MDLHSREQLLHLVPQLAALPTETGWVEFKTNNADPATIGKNISALANSAALEGQPFAYQIWGVRDDDHKIVGTIADPARAKHGNEDIANWLTTQLEPQTHFEFSTLEIFKVRVVVLTIVPAAYQPVQFQGKAYIRVGSYTKPLSKHQETERRLWRAFERQPFESGTALDRLGEDDVLRLLDYTSYFELLGSSLPDNRAGILEGLQNDDLISKMAGTGWRITNMGAILFAKHLDDFPSLKRKAMRVVQFKGSNRIEVLKDQPGIRGYASGFEGLISYINGVLPVNEVMGQALRTTTPMYPELAVRELVANALIHQDFSITGTGPMISIFEDRIEITNAGRPLVDIHRLIDAVPRSRNEKLASIMRRMGVCEEQGSGWDKVVFQIEYYQLPAPLARTGDNDMSVTMFTPRTLTMMDAEDKTRAVYLHACLRYTEQKKTNNASIRERFGIPEKNKATASRLLRDAVDAGLIAPYDAEAGTKVMRYVPFWAVAETRPGLADV